MTRHDYPKPINLNDQAWCYVDDRGLEIVVSWPNNVQTFRLTWRRLDRLRKQAAEARKRGECKP